MSILDIILQEVCSLTGENASAITSKSRVWSLMYARYLFYDIALRFGVKPSDAIRYIGRFRTMIYPYNRAVSDLEAVNPQFRKDRDDICIFVNRHLCNDTA